MHSQEVVIICDTLWLGNALVMVGACGIKYQNQPPAACVSSVSIGLTRNWILTSHGIKETIIINNNIIVTAILIFL